MKNFKENFKKISTKFNKLSTFKYFISWCVMFFTFIMFIFYTFGYFISFDDSNFNVDIFLKMSLSCSGFLSFVFSLLMIDVRKKTNEQKQFWNSAKELNNLLKDVKTKSDVDTLYPMYNKLIKMIKTGDQNYEVLILRTIIETKHDLLP